MSPATERVIRAVAAHMFVTFEQVMSTEKATAVSLARQVSIYVLRGYQEPQPSWPVIAREFGRDQKTAIKAVRRIGAVTSGDRNGAAIFAAVEAGRLALTALREDTEQELLVKNRERRNELMRQVRKLDDDFAQMSRAAS